MLTFADEDQQYYQKTNLILTILRIAYFKNQ